MKLWKHAEPNSSINWPQVVREKLSENAEIRPFPEAVTQLISALQDPEQTSATLAKIIESDPALAVRLLRIANSPLYGLSREVRSIAHATSIIGRRSLKTLAMSAAGASMFASGATAEEERELLWKHSLGTAVVARILAEFDPKICTDDAFLASIFHDVGKLFLLDIAAEVYAELVQRHEGAGLLEQERALFEIDHAELGFRAANAWNLAEDLKVAIGYHHRPVEAPVHQELAAIIHLSNTLSHAWGIGTSLKSASDNEYESSLEKHAFPAEVLAIVRERAESAYAEIR